MIQEPVTLNEIKAQCRIEHNADDDLLNSYIKAAREYCEGFLNIKLVEDEQEEQEQENTVENEENAVKEIEVKQKWKQAILLIVAHWYANRENASGGNLQNIPLGAEQLLWQDRDMPV